MRCYSRSPLHRRTRPGFAAILLTVALLTAVPIVTVQGTNLSVTVTTTMDMNHACATTGVSPCSLRDAIRYANANAAAGTTTINLPAGLYSLSQPGVNEDAALVGDLDITGNVAIIGADAPSTIVDGALQDRVFDVFSGGSLTIADVTIRRGNPTGVPVGAAVTGGGMRNAGTAILSHVILADNQVIGANPFQAPGQDARGGGIASSGGMVQCTACIFTGNRAVGGIGGSAPGLSGGGGIGGAIDLSGGSGSVTRSTFAGNQATGGDGGGGAGDAGGGTGGIGRGGAIANNGTLTIVGSTFTTDRATGGNGGEGGRFIAISGGRGGDGGSATGGAVASTANTATLANSTFFASVAIAGNGGAGGATTCGAACRGGDGGAGGNGAGGAVNATAGSVTLTNNTISGNSVSGGAGGPPGAAQSNPGSPGANGNGAGGAIANSGGSMQVVNTIAANTPAGGNCAGVFTDNGHNLQWNPSAGCAGFVPGDPRLGPLASNGGPTQTMAVQPGSAAVDAGNDAVCATAPVNNLDQRGVIRPQGAHCDIGAFEFAADTLSAPPARSIGRATVGAAPVPPPPRKAAPFPDVPAPAPIPRR